MVSEFRYNKLTRRWVLFAPNRAKRPTDFVSKMEQYVDIEHCPFEVGNEHMTPNELHRVGDNKHWKTRIVPNLYHALSIDVDLKSYKQDSFDCKAGFGAHEVIIETPNHDHQMNHFILDEFVDYLNSIKSRINDLKKDARMRYFSVFKNSGVGAGATIEHSHTQLIATPFIPKKIKSDLDFYSEYFKQNDREFFDDLIYDEKRFEKGVLAENNSFIAYCPFASTFAFEVLIVAKEDYIHSIVDCKDTHIYALSEIMENVFKKLTNTLGNFSFNLVIKNGDIRVDPKSNRHRFYVQISPRLYKIAGFELDCDIYINPFLPELAAEILKDER